MELIQTVTVGAGGAASMVFGTGGTLPTTYDDLYLVVSSRTSNTGTCALFISFNGSTSNFSSRALEGNGSSASSFTLARFIGGTNGSGTTANTFTSVDVYIPNYRSSVAKSYSANNANENNTTEAFQTIIAGLWNDTAPITSLTVTPQLGNFVEGSSASLYGIRKFNTSAQPKATGGAISFDAVNNKWVHVFSTSGTFTPTVNLTNVEYLVIAGGGGSGAFYSGGGGAGGYRSSVVGESSGGGASAESRLSLIAATNYTVTIGAGGSPGTNSNTGTQGSNSTFHTITAVGGGKANGDGSNNAGGSGGGGGPSSFTTERTGGAGTANQGFAGGNNFSFNDATGGGGGAGSAGSSGSSGTGGAGGSGVSSSITGTSVTRAGGGGGGGTPNGGTASGGGGRGSDNAQANPGVANTGGGGGGRYEPAPPGSRIGQNGGSGIVIVRYDA